MRVRRAVTVVVVAAGAMLPLVGVASALDSESLQAGLTSTPADDDNNDDESDSTNDDDSDNTNDDDSDNTTDDDSDSTDDDDSNQVGTLPQGGVATGDGSTVG